MNHKHTDILLSQITFWSKVDIKSDNECWLWLGPLRKDGYGQLQRNRKKVLTHRFSYEMAKGIIPKKLILDHLCRIRYCVNPNHLEAVTQKENTIRGETGKKTGERERAKTHCPQKHEYSKENTHITKEGHRKCRICSKIRQRKNIEWIHP